MTPRTHKLKTQHDYWEAVLSGDKRFEVRKNDRGFQSGDIVILEKLKPGIYAEYEYDHGDQNGFNRKPLALTFRIGWMLTGGQFGVEPGYVVFGLVDIE